MLPPAFAGVESNLWLLLVAAIRPGAAFFAAPLFGQTSVPVQVRFVIAVAIGMAGYAAVPFHLPADGVASFAIMCTCPFRRPLPRPPLNIGTLR